MEFGNIIYQFFHGEVFLSIMMTALISSGIYFRSTLLARADGDKEKFQKKSLKLWLASAFVMIAYYFYIMVFSDLEYQLLNVIAIVAISLVGIVGLVSWYDQWKLGQKTLEKYF